MKTTKAKHSDQLSCLHGLIHNIALSHRTCEIRLDIPDMLLASATSQIKRYRSEYKLTLHGFCFKESVFLTVKTDIIYPKFSYRAESFHYLYPSQGRKYFIFYVDVIILVNVLGFFCVTFTSLPSAICGLLRLLSVSVNQLKTTTG